MKKTYIAITPLLTDDELNFFHLFNTVCDLSMQIKAPLKSVWIDDNSASLFDGFEVINHTHDKNDLPDKFEDSFNLLKKYCDSPYLAQNLDIIIHYKDLFMDTKLSFQHDKNYKINYQGISLFPHLFKIVNIYHQNGLIRKLLNLNLKTHSFSRVVVNEGTDTSYIIEENNIYTASIMPNGCYQKIESIEENWGASLFEDINKKIFKDNLESNLTEKEYTSLSKI